MKAGVVHAREDIRYEEIEKPVPKKGQVLIKVKYTGICGSDIPRVNGDACHFFPNVLGHEFSGTVEEVGEGVTSVNQVTELQVYHLYHVWNVKTVRRVTTLCVNIIASLVPENSEALQSMWLFLKRML